MNHMDAFALGIVISSVVAAIVMTAIYAPMVLAGLLAMGLWMWALVRVLSLADREWQ
jgi:hypothetical protein